ncbi:LacI family DNA-binding transcriptional regulator [Pontiellaceae bacterium B12219]|nr:LacI family DNA-binding transcriptional regulator [Pontiellaceae bacterium B12219]
MSHQNQPRRITIRDIAKELNVSHTSVSLALRNRSGISEEQRARIKAKAAEMGYFPDPMLAALSNYRLQNREHPVQAALAWINTWDHPEELRGYHEFDLYWKGAFKAALNLGYHLEEFIIKDIPLHRLAQVLKARNISGVLLPPDRSSHIDWKGFDWSPFATVRFGRTQKPPQVNFVTSAQVQNAMMAFDEILKRGYNRIGFIGEKGREETFGAGFLWAQQELPIRQRLPVLLFNPSATDSECRASLDSWMKKYRPDAIFTRDKTLPDLLTSLGYRIPEDVGLATTSIIDTPIDTGIDQNSEEIGRAAVLSVVSQINNSSWGIPPIQHESLINGRWVDGSMLPDRLGA